MPPVTALYLRTAEALGDLLGDPRLDAAWAGPSALDGMTVGDLVAHLARAVLQVEWYLDGGPAAAGGADPAAAERDPLDAAGYYTALQGLDHPASPLNQGIRQRAREGAALGPAGVAAAVEETVERLRGRLSAPDAPRVITVFDGAVISVEEYLRTRIVEITVHTDDVLASLPPSTTAGDPLPEEAREEAIAVLLEVAIRRHGTTAVLRALARRERDPMRVLRVL